MKYSMIGILAAASFIACLPARAEEKVGNAQAFINETSAKVCAKLTGEDNWHCLKNFHALDGYALRFDAALAEFEGIKRLALADKVDNKTREKKYGIKSRTFMEKARVYKTLVETGVQGLAIVYDYRPALDPVLEKLK